MLDKKPYEIHISASRRPMQQSPPVLALGCCVRAVLNEEPCEIHISASRRLMQQSPAVLVLGCRTCTMLDEEPGKIRMPCKIRMDVKWLKQPRCLMKRS